jgi:hypothetical protein
MSTFLVDVPESQLYKTLFFLRQPPTPDGTREICSGWSRAFATRTALIVAKTYMAW